MSSGRSTYDGFRAVIKLVGRDERGRRVVAWAEADPLGVEPGGSR